MKLPTTVIANTPSEAEQIAKEAAEKVGLVVKSVIFTKTGERVEKGFLMTVDVEV